MSTPRLLHYIDKKEIRKITRQDVANADDIFGAFEPGSIKGKTPRKASKQTRNDMLPLPAIIRERYLRVILSTDIMKVNGIPFLVTISHGLNFGTVGWLSTQKAVSVAEQIKIVNSVYRLRGFKIDVMEADGQFEPIRATLADMHIRLDKTSRDEHVPRAERRIRTLKDRCRSIIQSDQFPFTKLPKVLISQLVSTCNFWLNVFPPADGVSSPMSPRELLTGLPIDMDTINLEFGE